MALYICPNHTDIGIHSDHGYLATLEQPSRTTLIAHMTYLQAIHYSTIRRVLKWHCSNKTRHHIQVLTDVGRMYYKEPIWIWSLPKSLEMPHLVCLIWASGGYWMFWKHNILIWCFSHQTSCWRLCLLDLQEIVCVIICNSISAPWRLTLIKLI